jgi:hypothetical protein
MLPFQFKVEKVEALYEKGMTPLRITVVTDFLKDEHRKEAKRNPGKFVASILPPSAEVRTCGWTRGEVGKAERIVGYLKTSPGHAGALESKSGHKAVFCSRIRADTRIQKPEPLEWIPRLRDESSLSYYARVLTLSAEARCPMVRRLACGGAGATPSEADTWSMACLQRGPIQRSWLGWEPVVTAV